MAALGRLPALLRGREGYLEGAGGGDGVVEYGASGVGDGEPRVDDEITERGEPAVLQHDVHGLAVSPDHQGLQPRTGAQPRPALDTRPALDARTAFPSRTGFQPRTPRSQ